MKTAYSYIRFSLKRQKKGDSYRRQLALTNSYCQRHNLELSELTLHDLGLSGFRGKNAEIGALGVFLEKVREGEIAPGSVLIVENLDRLSREQVLDALVPIQAILNAGIAIVAIMPNEIEYTKENLDFGKLVLLIHDLSLGYGESKKKSERLGEVWQEKRKNLAGAIKQARPSWLTTEKDGITWKVIKENAETIKDIFNWTIEGLGVSLIVKKLLAEKRPCFNPKL